MGTITRTLANNLTTGLGAGEANDFKLIKTVTITSATAYAEVYYNDTARRSGFDPIDTVEFDFVMDVSGKGAEPVTQAYTSLKTKAVVKDNRGKTKSLDYSKAKDV